MNNAPIYDVDYFIKKFEAIPEDRWCSGAFTKGNQHCAFGHCGLAGDTSVFSNTQSLSLLNLFGFTNLLVININDGKNEQYQQPTPKQRILAALYDIKRIQQPVHENISSEIAQWKIVEEREDRILETVNN